MQNARFMRAFLSMSVTLMHPFRHALHCCTTPQLECLHADLRRYSSCPNMPPRCLLHRRHADAAGFFACGHPCVITTGCAVTPPEPRTGCLLEQRQACVCCPLRTYRHAIPVACVAHSDEYSGWAVNNLWCAGQAARHSGTRGGPGMWFQSIADSHPLPSRGGGARAGGLHACVVGRTARCEILAAGA